MPFNAITGVFSMYSYNLAFWVYSHVRMQDWWFIVYIYSRVWHAGRCTDIGGTTLYSHDSDYNVEHLVRIHIWIAAAETSISLMTFKSSADSKTSTTPREEICETLGSILRKSVCLLTRGTSGLYFQVSGCPNFQAPAKPASDWLEKNFTHSKLWQNPHNKY